MPLNPQLETIHKTINHTQSTAYYYSGRPRPISPLLNVFANAPSTLHLFYVAWQQLQLATAVCAYLRLALLLLLLALSLRRQAPPPLHRQHLPALGLGHSLALLALGPVGASRRRRRSLRCATVVLEGRRSGEREPQFRQCDGWLGCPMLCDGNKFWLHRSDQRQSR